MGTTRRRRLCRVCAGKRALRIRTSSDPQGDGAAHVRLPRPFDQASPDGNAFVRLPTCHCAHGRAVRDYRRRWSRAYSPSRTHGDNGNRFRRGRGAVFGNTLFVGRKDQSRHRLLGIVAACARRLRHPLSARQRHAGAGAGQRAAPRTSSSNCGEAIFCSGRAMSPSCGTKRRSCMPTPITWRSPSRLPHHRSPAFAQRAARSSACAACRRPPDLNLRNGRHLLFRFEDVCRRLCTGNSTPTSPLVSP